MQPLQSRNVGEMDARLLRRLSAILLCIAVLCCAHTFDLCDGHRDKFLLLGFDEDEAKRLFKAHSAFRLTDSVSNGALASSSKTTSRCSTQMAKGSSVYLNSPEAGDLNTFCKLFSEHVRIYLLSSSWGGRYFGQVWQR